MDGLTQFREELNKIDSQLISLISDRFKIIHSVGIYKKENGIAVMQSDRVEEVKNRCVKIGSQFNLNEDFINHLYDLIIKEACRIEGMIINEEE